MKKLAVFALSVLPLAAGLVSPPADACGGAIYMDRFQAPKPTPPQLVAKGEKALEEGNSTQALSRAKSAYGNLAKLEVGNDAVRNRALRLAALATVRSGGELSATPAERVVRRDSWGDPVVHAKPVDVSPEAKSQRLEWAIGTLRALKSHAPDSPTAEADLGEALAAVPGHDREALDVLSNLAERDLLGSPTAYAQLARLRFQAGLTKKSVEAVQRCQEMTRTPAVCGVSLPTTDPA